MAERSPSDRVEPDERRYARIGRRPRVGRRVALSAAAAGVVIAGYLAQAGPGTADEPLDSRRALIAPLEVFGYGPERASVARAAVDRAARDVARTGVVQVVVPGLAGLPDPSVTFEPSPLGSRERAVEVGAGLVVSGSLSSRNGQDVLEAAVVETATGRILARVGPVALDLAEPATGVAEFGDRVAGAVAVAADPTLGEWVATVREPPDFRAYRGFTDGLDALAGGRALEAAEHFLEAASRDTNFVTAKIWAVRSLVHAHRHEQADSVARSILHLRSGLTGWDRAMLDYYTGYLWGTWDEAYEAAREIVRLAPDPDWRHQLAGAALVAGRPREAREILEGLQEEERWIRDWPARWGLLADAVHELGEFEVELELAQQWRDASPRSSESTTLRALAALGRFEELADLLSPLLENRPSTANARRLKTVADELRAHGHDQRARDHYLRLLAWLDARPEPGTNVRAQTRLFIELLIATGDYEEAYERAVGLGPEIDFSSGDAKILFEFLRGLAAAHLGNDDEARAIAETIQDDDPLTMGHYTAMSAMVIAALGDREGATNRLALAFSQGFGRYPWLHTVPEFLPLAGYEPFRRIVRPEP